MKIRIVMCHVCLCKAEAYLYEIINDPEASATKKIIAAGGIVAKELLERIKIIIDGCNGIL